MATWVIPKDKIHSFHSFKERVNVENVLASLFIPVPETVATTVYLCTSSPQPLATTCSKLIACVSIIVPVYMIRISKVQHFHLLW